MPQLTFDDWLAVAYGVPAEKAATMGDEAMLRHAIWKWACYAPDVHAFYNVTIAHSRNQSVKAVDNTNESPRQSRFFFVYGAETCALCVNYASAIDGMCEKCPITQTTGTCCISAYNESLKTKNPAPILAQLNKTLNALKA